MTLTIPIDLQDQEIDKEEEKEEEIEEEETEVTEEATEEKEEEVTMSHATTATEEDTLRVIARAEEDHDLEIGIIIEVEEAEVDLVIEGMTDTEEIRKDRDHHAELLTTGTTPDQTMTTTREEKIEKEAMTDMIAAEVTEMVNMKERRNPTTRIEEKIEMTEEETEKEIDLLLTRIKREMVESRDLNHQGQKDPLMTEDLKMVALLTKTTETGKIPSIQVQIDGPMIRNLMTNLFQEMETVKKMKTTTKKMEKEWRPVKIAILRMAVIIVMLKIIKITMMMPEVKRREKLEKMRMQTKDKSTRTIEKEGLYSRIHNEILCKKGL